MKLISLAGVILVISFGIAGCVAIKGVSNTSLVRPMPPASSFLLENMNESDPSVARKVGQMIAYQLLRHGFKNPAKASDPDLLVRFSFDVVPAGTTSTAFTTINQPRQSYYVSGDTVVRKASASTATTYIDTDQNYRKTIAIRILDTKTGAAHWEGQVSEEGWCPRIFVTAPNILALMFDRFPADATNVSRQVGENDAMVQELRKLFPPDTNWGCR